MEATLATTQTHLEAFFDALLAAFARTRQEEGITSRHWNIAGRTVNLSVADSLAYLARPLDHLKTTPTGKASPSDLTLYAWQGSQNGPPLELPWQDGSASDSIGLSTDRFRVHYHAPSGLLCMWDRHTHTALYWIRRVTDLPFWEIASPFRILFHWWAQSWGGQVAHAAAVGVDGRGVLLAGKSGHGKSTAALACLRDGLDFVGDDYVVLTADPIPAAHSLYSSAKMHAATLTQYFPEWTGHIGVRVGPVAKCVLYLPDVPGIRLRPQLDLCAIVTPEVTADACPALVSATDSQSWLALVPSTVFQLPDARHTTLAFFSDFLRRLPSYRLTTGRDLTLLPRVLRAFLLADGTKG